MREPVNAAGSENGNWKIGHGITVADRCQEGMEKEKGMENGNWKMEIGNAKWRGTY